MRVPPSVVVVVAARIFTADKFGVMVVTVPASAVRMATVAAVTSAVVKDMPYAIVVTEAGGGSRHKVGGPGIASAQVPSSGSGGPSPGSGGTDFAKPRQDPDTVERHTWRGRIGPSPTSC